MGKLNWLAQNAKMRRSSTQYDIYNFGIPAFLSETGIKTCPNAGRCAAGCYARSGSYRFSNVARKYEARLKLTQSVEFFDIMVSEIETAIAKASKRGKECLIRIHDSGDFYSLDYYLTWSRIMKHFDGQCNFYAYTKQVEMFQSLSQDDTYEMPQNFTLIFSYGGKQDHLIDPERDRHSAVFQNEIELALQGYADASHDDTVALGSNLKIGLIYHGSKNYANTAWDKVSVPK